ncbi:MAG: hypothetical protein ACLUV3_00215 [Oscillospiraceae bacterium]
MVVPTFSAALSAVLLPSGIAPQGGVVLGAVDSCRKYYGVTSGALHRCNRCSAAFFLRPFLCRSGKICPSGLCVSNSASAVMKGCDAYANMIGFNREI